VSLACLEKLVVKVPLDLLVFPESKEVMDKEDHRVGEDHLESKECLEQKDLKVLLVLMDQMVHLDPSDLMDLLVTEDLLASLVQLDRLED